MAKLRTSTMPEKELENYTDYLVQLIKDSLRWDEKRVVLVEGPEVENILYQSNLHLLIHQCLYALVTAGDTPVSREVPA